MEIIEVMNFNATARFSNQSVAIISPIIPFWCIPYYFFQPLRVYEKYGIQFECFDCLAPIIGIKTMQEATKIWEKWLKTHISYFDIFIGFAFGGTLLQSLFETGLLANKHIILFSSPSVADQALKRKLNIVLSLAKQHKVQSAIRCLDYYASNKFSLEKNLSCTKKNQDIILSRLITGCHLICQADTKKSLQHTPSSTLALVGENSKLATIDNVLIENKIIVPQASMRLFDDNPDFVYQTIDPIFLSKEASC